MKQNHLNKVDDYRIIECYNSGITLHEASSKLSMSVVSLWRRAKKLDLKWSNIKRKSVKKIDLFDILEGKYPSYQTFKLRNRLISEGIKYNICEICNLSVCDMLSAVEGSLSNVCPITFIKIIIIYYYI